MTEGTREDGGETRDYSCMKVTAQLLMTEFKKDETHWAADDHEGFVVCRRYCQRRHEISKGIIGLGGRNGYMQGDVIGLVVYQLWQRQLRIWW